MSTTTTSCNCGNGLKHIQSIQLKRRKKSVSLSQTTASAFVGIWIEDDSSSPSRLLPNNRCSGSSNLRRRLVLRVLQGPDQDKKNNNDNDDDEVNSSNSSSGSELTVFQEAWSEEDVQRIVGDIVGTKNDNSNRQTASTGNHDTCDDDMNTIVSILIKTSLTTKSLRQARRWIQPGGDDSDEGNGSNNPCEEDGFYQRLQSTFYLIHDDDPATVELQVLKRMPSGLVRKPWTATLKQITDGERKEDKSSRTTPAMEFIQSIVRGLHDQQDQSSKLLAEKLALEKNRDGWKDTAEKLSGEWEGEKNSMLQNFLDVYEDKQRQVDSLRGTIDGLQQQLDESRELLQRAARNRQREAATSAKDALLAQLPDDQDRELYDAETVALLAAGPGRKKDSSSSGRSKRASSTITSTSSPAQKPPQKRRRNETTGAYEYYDSNALFEDVSVFPSQQEGVDEGKADEDLVGQRKTKWGKNPPAATKPRPKRRAAKSHEEESTMDSDRNNKQSNNDNDDDLVDPGIRSYIMSQLDELAKEEEKNAVDNHNDVEDDGRGVL